MKNREIDALLFLYMKYDNVGLNDLLLCRRVDGDVQPNCGYPLGHVSPPKYTESLDSIWDVVTKLNSKGYYVALSTAPGGKVRASVQELGKGIDILTTSVGLDGTKTVDSNTPARALGLAILKHLEIIE